MARIKLGSIVTDLSGSAGGGIIQNSRAGHILRNKPAPCNPTTSVQLSIRSMIKSLQRSWTNLIDQQRQEWNEFPKWANQVINDGSGVLLSGHDLYLKYQFLRLLTGLPLLTTIQYIPFPSVPGFRQFYNYLGTFRLRFWSNVDHTSYFFICKASKVINPSQYLNSVNIRFMLCKYQTHYRYIITDPFISAFGIIPENGEYIRYSLQWFSVLSPIYTKIESNFTEVIPF